MSHRFFRRVLHDSPLARLAAKVVLTCRTELVTEKNVSPSALVHGGGRFTATIRHLQPFSPEDSAEGDEARLAKLRDATRPLAVELRSHPVTMHMALEVASSNRVDEVQHCFVNKAALYEAFLRSTMAKGEAVLVERSIAVLRSMSLWMLNHNRWHMTVREAMKCVGEGDWEAAKKQLPDGARMAKYLAVL